MDNKLLEKEYSRVYFMKWGFLVLGMLFVFCVYMIVSDIWGSNVYYNENVVNTELITTANTDPTTSEPLEIKAYFGAEISDITDVMIENLDLKGKVGVFVERVIAGSPAQKAGFMRGDIIATFNNRDTEDVESFKEQLALVNPGDIVRIVYVRDGKKQSVYATLADIPSAILKTATTTNTASVDVPSDNLGASLSTLTEELRAYYNIPNKIDGIIVLSVEQNAAADRAGLESGDVITAIGTTPVANLTEFFDLLEKEADDIVLLDVFSDGKMQYVTISLASFQYQTQPPPPATTFLDNTFLSLFGSTDDSTNPDLNADGAWDFQDDVTKITPADYNSLLRWMPLIGLSGLVFALLLFLIVCSYPNGNKKMQKVSDKIRSGAFIFLKKEYKVISMILAGGFLCIWIFLGFQTAIAFVLGASCSMLVGYLGIKATTAANIRTAQGAKDGGLNKALRIGFNGGAVMGISVSAIGILGISAVYFLTSKNLAVLSTVSIGFALGASTVALFARVGGGIFTKSADIGSDLVGKLELEIPEDDPRNPGVIADNVGDCVGDTAGMGADLFESYAGSVIAALAIGATTTECVTCISLPLVLVCIGLVSSIIAVLAFPLLTKKPPQTALRNSTLLASVLFLIGSFLAIRMLFGDLNLFWVIVVGSLCGFLMGVETEYFTSGPPVKSIAIASESGGANNIITGFAIGFKSAILPILTNCFTVLIAYKLGGLYGIAISAVSMLATIGIVMTVDSYGPIADSAGGIAQLSGMGGNVRDVTDELDAVGNTTAAVGKGFAIGSAAMTAVSFFSAYLTLTGINTLSLTDIRTSFGLLIGAVVPFGIAALTMDSVGRIANTMVLEIRRQFATIKGLKEGTAEPDTDKCIEIVTKGSLDELVLPGMIAVFAPILMGLLAGNQALGGFLAGAILTGLILGIVMTNAGAAWDNAKKLIEKGEYGGKNSTAHKSSIIGDTVGDPLKDTAGPAMNIIIKLMSLISLLFAHFFVL